MAVDIMGTTSAVDQTADIDEESSGLGVIPSSHRYSSASANRISTVSNNKYLRVAAILAIPVTLGLGLGLGIGLSKRGEKDSRSSNAGSAQVEHSGGQADVSNNYPELPEPEDDFEIDLQQQTDIYGLPILSSTSSEDFQQQTDSYGFPIALSTSSEDNDPEPEDDFEIDLQQQNATEVKYPEDNAPSPSDAAIPGITISNDGTRYYISGEYLVSKDIIDDSMLKGDNNSYQGQAFRNLQKNGVNAGYTDQKIAQRYALLCLYYSTHRVRTDVSDEAFGYGVFSMFSADFGSSLSRVKH